MYANVTIPKIVCTPSWQRLCFDKIAKTSEEMTLYAFCICQPYKLDFPISIMFVEKDTFELGLIYYAVHGRLVFIFGCCR